MRQPFFICAAFFCQGEVKPCAHVPTCAVESCRALCTCNYLHSGDNFRPPHVPRRASMRMRQQGLTLRLKFFNLPPQQHRNRMISSTHVQLQPPVQPLSPVQPQPPSLNKPLNMFYLRFADCSALVFDCFQSVLLYDFVENFVTAHTVNHWRKLNRLVCVCNV